MKISVELTTQSSSEYDRLRSGQLTPSMAAEYLKEGRIVLRSFSETLRSLCPEADLTPTLTAAFRAAEPEADPASVARRVRNWVSGQNVPCLREDVFIIAFALQLSESDASLLLGQATGYGIHYREGRDVIYAWFLRTGRTYLEARDFFAALPPIPHPDTFPTAPGVHVTRELQGNFSRVHTEEELRACYIANLEHFGQLHLRAYVYFEKYLNILLHPAPVWDGQQEPDYSIEAVMQTYLTLHMPSSRARRNYSLVQKLIKSNWPNTTALKNIRLHKEDVPRKLLLLFYVITENITDGTYSELDEDYVSSEDRLEDHWWTLNAILTDCGMAPLDPRSAFDWLVLYSITADEESMSDRMAQVIDHMYADVAQQGVQEKREKGNKARKKPSAN